MTYGSQFDKTLIVYVAQRDLHRGNIGFETRKTLMARVVAVTGGTGFVALELVKQLLSTGYTVRATVRNKHGGGTTDVLSALGQALPGKF